MSGRREFWGKHVARWQASGLIARDYATKAGINPLTLKYMKYVLKKEARSRSQIEAPKLAAMPLVEVLSSGALDRGFELELVDGRRLRIPSAFEASALRRLLGVLGSPS